MNAQVTHTPGPWNCHFHDIETTLRPGTFRINMSGAVTAGVWSSGALRDEVEATARLIAAAPDHALIASALCAGIARWEKDTNEFCITGLRHSAKLDEFGVPAMTSGMRAAIASATGAQP